MIDQHIDRLSDWWQVAKDKADAAEVAGEAPTDKSMFHGKSLKDYAGRSWLEAPKDLKAENEHCFLPKRWVHTWSGHTKGVNAIRCSPCASVLRFSWSPLSREVAAPELTTLPATVCSVILVGQPCLLLCVL